MAKVPLKPPANGGRIVIKYDDLDQLRFWIRVFNVEREVTAAQLLVTQQHSKAGEPAAYAAVPVISEYTAGSLYWTYVLVLFIDRLGISGGSGMIYYADEKNLPEARKRRDKFADEVLAEMHKKPSFEQIIIEPGTEKDVG